MEYGYYYLWTEDDGGFPLDPNLWTQRHWRRWPTADARPYRVVLVVDTTRLFWELWIESVSQLYSIVVINGCGDLQMLVNEAAKTGMFFITLLFSFLCLVSAVRRWPSAHLHEYRASSPVQYSNMHGINVHGVQSTKYRVVRNRFHPIHNIKTPYERLHIWSMNLNLNILWTLQTQL